METPKSIFRWQLINYLCWNWSKALWCQQQQTGLESQRKGKRPHFDSGLFNQFQVHVLSFHVFLRWIGFSTSTKTFFFHLQQQNQKMIKTSPSFPIYFKLYQSKLPFESIVGFELMSHSIALRGNPNDQ